MTLNPRQEAFCWNYAKTGNATESYKQAGYSVKNDNSAGTLSSRLLQNIKIRARLAEIVEELNSAKIAITDQKEGTFCFPTSHRISNQIRLFTMR